MDEIKYKLKSKNVVVVTEALSLLLKCIEKLGKVNGNSSDLEEYMQLLREQCVSSNHIISSTACFSFIKLIQDEVLDIDSCLSTVMSLLLSVENYSGILSIISNILIESVVQDTKNNSSYLCKWSVTVPLHPFIFVLQQKPCSIDKIISKMDMICSPQSRIYAYALELFHPTFVWIMCDKENCYTVSQRKDTLNIILNYKKCQEQVSLLLECLTWQEVSTDNVQTSFYLYLATEKWSHERNEKDLHLSLLPVFINIAQEMIISGLDPTHCFKIINKLISMNDNIEILSFSMGLIAEMILICPVLYMEELLNLSKIGAVKNKYRLTDYMILSALIQWDYNKTILTTHFSNLIDDILNIIMNKSYDSRYSTQKNEVFEFFMMTNTKIFKMHEFHINYNQVVHYNDIEWIRKWKVSNNVSMKSSYLLFFQSLLLMPLEDKNSNIKVDIVKIITDLILKTPDTAIGQLPVTLYSLKISNNPILTVELLKGIPILASLMENISVIVGLLKKFNNKITFPKSLLIDLYLKLYIQQNRCFSYLQTIIAENLKKVHDENDKWQILLSQANAMKYICENDGVNNGLNMAPLICGIIDQSKTEICAISCCISLEALKYLLKEEIIDPISTWHVLSPKLHGEKREAVLISMCELLKIIPTIDCKSAEYLDFMDSTIMRLWKYTDDSYSYAVNKSAFNALSQYKLETMNLKQIPNKYKEGVTVPSKILELKSDDSVKPEDILNYIPNIVWGNLFKYTRQDSLEGVVDLCSALINHEISSYRSGIYEITVAEPESVKYLPNTSVVRGVLEFLRKEILKKDIGPFDISIIHCIKCISMSFDKPLPPLNWNFLSAAIFNFDPNITIDNKIIIMQLLAKLSGTSQSAMKIITTYLESLIDIHEEKHIQILSSILPSISTTVKSVSLINTTNNCFHQYFSLLQMVNKESKGNLSDNHFNNKTCVDLIRAMCNCIQNEAVHINVKNSFFLHVKYLWDIIDCDSAILDEFSTICCRLPSEILQEILQPHNEKNYTLRCKLAMDNTSENPLNWLNDLIDLGIDSFNERKNILTTLIRILRNTEPNLKSTQQWILQLKSKIQINLGQQLDQESLEYLFDILFLSVVIFSQHSTVIFYENEDLFSKHLQIFPQCLRTMIEVSKEWENVGCQLLEWLQYCLTTGMISKRYHKVIYSSFAACQGTPNFKRQNIWIKYTSLKPDFRFN